MRLELAVYHLERYTQDEVVLEWPLVTQPDLSVWFPCCPTVRVMSGLDEENLLQHYPESSHCEVKFCGGEMETNKSD